MEKSFNIFDIDSALDLLEDSLDQNSYDNGEEKLINTTNSSQSLQLDSNDNKENGNLSGADALEESISAPNEITQMSEEQETSDKLVEQTDLSTTLATESFCQNNGNLEERASTSIDKTIENSSLTSSSPDDSSQSSTNDYDEKDEMMFIPPTDDSLKQQLISEESSNQQSLTNDVTLTKTVPLTELEPDPEDEVQPEPAKVKCEDVPLSAPPPAAPEKQFENDVSERKEVSINNLDTMDDISDAELESLEQELEELMQSKSGQVTESEIVVELPPKPEEKVLAEPEEKIESVLRPEPVDFKTAETNDAPVDSVVPVDDSAPVSEQSVISQQEISVIETEKNESSVSEAQEAVEPASSNDVDPVISTSTEESTSIQNLPSQSNEDFSNNESNSTASLTSAPELGKVPPYWIPDNLTNNCMQCDSKFTVIRRRHHCRACGLLLCSNCCSEKHFLIYLGNEGRICGACNQTLIELNKNQPDQSTRSPTSVNPANPMEYCSVVPPQQQVGPNPVPPTVMVPTGVLKRGPRTSERKSVIFSDGVRPGDANITDLEDPNLRTPTTPPEPKQKFNVPKLNDSNNSFIPDADNELPPVLLKDNDYRFVDNNLALVQRLRQEQLRFAINANFHVICKIVTLTCCTNKTVINFSTSGLLTVRQDEMMILLELNDDMTKLPKEVFLHLMEIFNRADKGGPPINEYGHSQAASNNFLGAFGGFLYIKPTFQCLESLTLPEKPYLIGLLVHRWEIPWMRLFPLRLILRLGAMHRYYPTAIVSNINREPVYAEIGNTIMNFLADFRSYSYTIETVKSLYIHMEERKTTVLIPKNRYEQVMKAVSNSSDHLLAFGADFSKKADGHLVCIQNIDSTGTSDSNSYSTQAINIQGQTRIRTGASFIIFNGALKQSSGFKAKCSIVEDGIMVQIMPTKMISIRDALKNMKNIEILCGLSEPTEEQSKETEEETVSIEWVDDDLSFNIGVVSPIDNQSMEGKESVRTKLDLSNKHHTIRWTEVFLLDMNDDGGHINDDHLNYSKVAESIARASCQALLPFIDLMAVNQLRKIGIRVTLGENINYLAGSNNNLLSPIYMNALDNELIGLIHRQASNMSSGANLTMELIFYIMNK